MQCNAMCENDQPVVGGKEAQYKQWLFMQQQATERKWKTNACNMMTPKILIVNKNNNTLLNYEVKNLASKPN